MDEEQEWVWGCPRGSLPIPVRTLVFSYCLIWKLASQTRVRALFLAPRRQACGHGRNWFPGLGTGGTCPARNSVASFAPLTWGWVGYVW